MWGDTSCGFAWIICSFDYCTYVNKCKLILGDWRLWTSKIDNIENFWVSCHYVKVDINNKLVWNRKLVNSLYQSIYSIEIWGICTGGRAKVFSSLLKEYNILRLLLGRDKQRKTDIHCWRVQWIAHKIFWLQRKQLGTLQFIVKIFSTIAMCQLWSYNCSNDTILLLCYFFMSNW